MQHHIVLAYHSYNDSILKGLLLRYLQSYQRRAGREVTFHYITFEQRAYQMEPSEQVRIYQARSKENITWHPVTYHSGGKLLLFKKAYDFLTAFFLILTLRVKYNAKHIIGFTSISSVMAWVASRLLGMKSTCFNVEPHSKYMAEFGIWSQKSFSYKILRYLEIQMMRRSDYLAFPTQNGVKDFSYERNEKLYFVPTSIDVTDFEFDEQARKQYRATWKIPTNAEVIVYLGKFDGIYFSAKKTAEFFKKLAANSNKELIALIITPDPTDEVDQIFRTYGPEKYRINGPVAYKELSGYLSATDAGLLILPPYPSQRYRCPIKTANYLACGLPIIINDIVGDEPQIVSKHQVGWVVDLENPSIDFSKRPDRKRCMEVVQQTRDIQLIVDFLWKGTA